MGHAMTSAARSDRRARLKIVIAEPAESENIERISRMRLCERRERRERRIAREQREAHREKRAGWIAAEDVVLNADNPNNLIRALKSGAVDCLFVHPTRWWLKPSTVPQTAWEGAQFKNGKLWRNGVCLEGPHQQLVIDERHWREWLGEPSLEAAAPVTAEEIPVEKTSNAGAPPQHDWDEAIQYVRQLWEERGDPRNPLNERDGWRSDIALARRVTDHLRTRDPGREPPEAKTVADKIRPEIKKLRGQ